MPARELTLKRFQHNFIFWSQLKGISMRHRKNIILILRVQWFRRMVGSLRAWMNRWCLINHATFISKVIPIYLRSNALCRRGCLIFYGNPNFSFISSTYIPEFLSLQLQEPSNIKNLFPWKMAFEVELLKNILMSFNELFGLLDSVLVFVSVELHR